MTNHWLKKLNERLLPFYGTMLEIEQNLQFKEEENGNLVIFLDKEAIPGTIYLKIVRNDGSSYNRLLDQGGRNIIISDLAGVTSISATYEYARDPHWGR